MEGGGGGDLLVLIVIRLGNASCDAGDGGGSGHIIILQEGLRSLDDVAGKESRVQLNHRIPKYETQEMTHKHR